MPVNRILKHHQNSEAAPVPSKSWIRNRKFQVSAALVGVGAVANLLTYGHATHDEVTQTGKAFQFSGAYAGESSPRHAVGPQRLEGIASRITSNPWSHGSKEYATNVAVTLSDCTSTQQFIIGDRPESGQYSIKGVKPGDTVPGDYQIVTKEGELATCKTAHIGDFGLPAHTTGIVGALLLTNSRPTEVRF